MKQMISIIDRFIVNFDDQLRFIASFLQNHSTLMGTNFVITSIFNLNDLLLFLVDN